MKVFLDLLPAAAFLIALYVGDIYSATAALIASLWLAVLAWRLWFKTVRRTHLAVAALATVLGGLTLYLHDPMFIKWKPTLVYAAFALGLAGNLVLGRPPLLQKLLGELFELSEAQWRRVDAAWIVFWLACAALNLVVAYNFSATTWGTYKIASGFLLPILFVLGHLPFLSRHLKHEPPAP